MRKSALLISFVIISGFSVFSQNDIDKEKLREVRQELHEHLTEGIMPFWTERGVDEKYGGYLTTFDENGELITDNLNKYIVTQTRMIWGFSVYHQMYPDNEYYLEAARQGVDFFIRNFWDPLYGGWYWEVTREGAMVDDGKVVYGQSFAIYALTEYYLATGDQKALDYAIKTFDLLQEHCADAFRGGYYENLEPDWTISDPGFHAGDRKSLDIHMHLMECFTNLYKSTGKNVHRKRLDEVISVILTHMVNKEIGCGLNQFTLDFESIPAIAIRRTWNADREENEEIDEPKVTTSYGHNIELIWLLIWADKEMGVHPVKSHMDIAVKMTDQAIKYGLDKEYGGVYRDGPLDGPAMVKDKEFWQNSEALIGFLTMYNETGDKKYLDAFYNVWNFADEHMINHELGEWMTLLNRQGEPIDPRIGNPWKCTYHSGRSVMEAIDRIDKILEK